MLPSLPWFRARGRYLLNFDSVADRAILQALLVHNTILAPELVESRLPSTSSTYRQMPTAVPR